MRSPTIPDVEHELPPRLRRVGWPAADAGKTALFRRRRPAPQRALVKMRTDRFALADLGQQDRLDVNERSNTSTGKSTDGDLHDLGLRWASENTTGREAASCFSSSSGHFLNDE
ncbi:hypothetical protein EHU61_18445 [Escherichia coli]|nr:hypothetical protein [Escherichia coli]